MHTGETQEISQNAKSHPVKKSRQCSHSAARGRHDTIKLARSTRVLPVSCNQYRANARS